jgi:DNA-binding Lrp family transcriptional regulator
MKKKAVDVQDIRILNILMKNAGITNKDLAQKLNLSEGATLVRLQHLWERGIIESYMAKLNYPYFGYDKQFCLRINSLEMDSLELIRRLKNSRYVVNFFCVDTEDFVIRDYTVILQTSDLKAADEECHRLIDGISGIKAVTLSRINLIYQKALSLEDNDIVK